MGQGTLRVFETYLVRYGPQEDGSPDPVVIRKPQLEGTTPDLRGKVVKIKEDPYNPGEEGFGLVFKYWFDDVGLRAQVVLKKDFLEMAEWLEKVHSPIDLSGLGPLEN